MKLTVFSKVAIARALLAACLCLSSGLAVAQSRVIELPSLGEAGSGTLSLDQERQIGESWLRSYYRQTPIYRDYLMQSYIEGLVQKLAPYSALEQVAVKVLVIDSPSMNAFAVPGGVIGINTGLLLHAQTEDELASVIAHEIAHLSQRHFSRSVADRKASSVGMLAGLLASVVLAATTGSDAGLAMMSLSQGLTLESQLRYSRQNETEADRIGQDTLARAGYDPHGTVRMFERMQAATRFSGELAPEYLLTHPLPQSRVVDAETRADQYPSLIYRENTDYALYKARMQVFYAETAQAAERSFGDSYRRNPESSLAKYGYALALLRSGQTDIALSLARELLDEKPTNLVMQAFYTDALMSSEDFEAAYIFLDDALSIRPSNHPLVMRLAAVLNRLNRFEDAARLLKAHSQKRPKDPVVWYELAETFGLAGDIYQVHLTRAEYFLLVGSFDRATEHLRLAKQQLGDNPIEQAVLDDRLQKIAQMKAAELEL